VKRVTRTDPVDTPDGATGPAQVTRGSLALGLSVLFTAVGGLLFWLIAARLEPAATVGRSQALFQVLAFVNYVANVGLPVALARYVGRSESRMANWMIDLRAVLAVVTTGVFLVAAGSTDLVEPLWSRGYVFGCAVFVFVGVGMALAVLAEMRLMTLRMWTGVVSRSALAALLRLPLVIPLALGWVSVDHASLWLFVIATVPIAVTGYAAVLYLRLTRDRDRGARYHVRPPEGARHVVRFAGVNWLGLLATQGPIFAVPVVVAFTVDSATNAPFFVAWSFGAIAFLIPQVIGQVTLSEASQEGHIDRKLSHALKLALLATCAASVVAQLFSGVLASVYGAEYGDLAVHTPLLVGASIAWSYTSLALTAARITDRIAELLILSVFFLCATMIPTLVLTPGLGADAATWSWLGGNAAAALLAAVMHYHWHLGAPASDPLDAPAPKVDR